ncbi:putative bifunctional diguanylate cyclase/phosphodiesterase [Thiococcus pfennigii]|uniref:putative bifunctional diguanylate cyclase/phosphodiesterase n=1 Tax=Thiococcus pfennigii TaxID=1057 RepID=UPI00190587CE|nr:EAL domain-containing protein [Thiococcus pfennigii]
MGITTGSGDFLRLQMGKRADYQPEEVTEKRLRHAIDHGELVLHFQPKISLLGHGNGRIEGAEALVRWNDPRHGLRPPFEFIPLAERSGLIEPLTFYVLDAAVRQGKAWRDAGLPLAISVNLPASMVNDRRLPNRVADALAGAHLPPEGLILEVTETGAMVDSAITVESLTRLRVKGIGLAIDDFGTGYSSLIELYRMPFSELKIDRSFVMECDHEEEARTIVEATIALAHKLGLVVCAEGVESGETLRFLQGQGCELAQGFFISRPLPPERFAEFAAAYAGKAGP